MEDLTFRLDGLPSVKGSTINFEGPLTLILQLLSKNRIEIKDVSISQILDQYMAWLDQMKAMDLEVATEFVTMASHLVYIKARSLLNDEEAVQEMEELVTSLELLRAREQWESLKDITAVMLDMFREGSGQLPKPRSPLPDVPFRNEPEEPENLLRALIAALELSEEDERRMAIKPVPMPVRITYSVDAASVHIVQLMRDRGELPARELFAMAESRSEIVAMFLAVLELASDGGLAIRGWGDDVVFAPVSASSAEDEDGAS